MIRPPGTILYVPYTTGNPGEVINWRSGEGNVGVPFLTTIIISRCPGVWSPYADIADTSKPACVMSGISIGNLTVVGKKEVLEKRYPASFSCFLEPNTQYYATIYQRDPWVPALDGGWATRETCIGNVRCGLILDFKNVANIDVEG